MTEVACLYTKMYERDPEAFYEQYEQTFIRQKEIHQARVNLYQEEQSLLEHRAAMMRVIGEMASEGAEL